MAGREQLVADVAEQLTRLGVCSGDVVMLHASLRAIGPVVGGASGVLDAVQRTLGSQGTVLMVLGAHDEWSWVNERPQAERARLLRDADPFDHLVTPADAEVGILAEVFRTRPGTVVSDHPEGRFAAWGANADALVSGVPWDDYYGPGSPLERLVGAGGRVLRLGADPDTVTLVHYAEYLADLPSKRRVRRHRLVSAPGGAVVRTVDCLDDTNGIVSWPGEDYFITIIREYLAAGRGTSGMVGCAPSELIDAADLVRYAVAWMAEHLGGNAST